MSNRIYVGGLADETTEDALAELFRTYGPITSIAITSQKDSPNNVRFGIVEMPSSQDAMKAMMNINRKDLDGRKLKVNQASLLRNRR